jgi:predicted  nucleic acid-binding Zn-ribbon protein
MRFKCVRCGRYEDGPVRTRRICPICKEEMVPVVTATEDGKQVERTLKKIEEGGR